MTAADFNEKIRANGAPKMVTVRARIKLNFNECKYGDANPVTIGFSDAVGEILVSNPKLKDPIRNSNSTFKSHMV